MEYKGYTARVEFDAEDRVFHGRVLGIQDVISFEGDSVEEHEQGFREAVDDYFALCAERGYVLNKPFSGQLSVQLPSQLHPHVEMEAARRGLSMNELIVEAIVQEVRPIPVAA